MSLNTAYRDTIDYLYALQKHGVKLALANTVRLMELMGNPHKKFRSVHVAGTNGKGSTSAFIAQMLMGAGYRVGLYTSPHLVSFTERIRINGKPISEETVVALTRRVRDAYQQAPEEPGSDNLNPTFFEVTTAVAFTCFAEAGIDIAVVETGMGGRLDATNVISPLVSVITNIDLEHTEFLGATLELIAGEKAGIIKPDVPVVSGALQPEVTAVLERQAELKGARMARLGREFYPDKVGSVVEPAFDYHGIDKTYEGLHLQMIGRYQVDNACLALAAIECLHDAGISVEEEAVRRGLALARWEGRMERVARKPDLFLDGAHNPSSADRLASALSALMPSYGKILLVLGVLGDKDFRGIVRELAPLAARVIVTKPQYSRALDVEILAAEVRKFHDDVVVTETVADALSRVRSFASADDLVIVTGSLYVVGDARALLVADAGKDSVLAGLKG
jgi:dihydrofolate synthase / folylpolyglutamate synthase